MFSILRLSVWELGPHSQVDNKRLTFCWVYSTFSKLKKEPSTTDMVLDNNTSGDKGKDKLVGNTDESNWLFELNTPHTKSAVY